MPRNLCLAPAGVAALALATAVQAQQVPTGGDQPPVGGQSARTTNYDAAFFAQYAPRNAYDIAQRVPGFALDLGANANDVDVRGFAGVAGNVVINGARPSSKAERLDVMLQRIPAQRVVRVEIGPGDVYGSDYAGKSQVLNIILSGEGGFDANVTAAGTRRYTGYVNTDIQGSALYRRGPSTFNLSAGTGRNRQLEEGTDTIDDVDSGDLVEHRRKHNDYFNKDPFIAGSWALERGSDNAIRLNARWQPSRFDLFQRNRVTPAEGDPHDDNLIQHYKRPVIELGGDITRPLGGGAIKLVGLATRRKRTDFDGYILRNGLLEENASVVGGSEQTLDARRNETIGRLSWTRSDLWGLSVEAGVEGAYNTLDSHLTLFEIDENGDKVPIDLPIENATVKEKRGEVYVRAGKSVSKAIRIDAGANFEYSDLTVSGDTSAARQLKFLKPNFAVDWQPGDDWHARLSVRRTVAQLDFYDFISIADLSAIRVSGGNADLQPQRTWESRLTVEHPILGDGLIKVELGNDLVSMLQDRVLLCQLNEEGVEVCLDSPGNLGTGKRYFGRVDFEAPLGGLWKGLRLKGNATLQRTRVKDPIDGRQRNWTGYFPDWEWYFELRRDVGAWSYGMAVNDNKRFTFYRTDEFDTNFNGGPYGTAFIEYRLSPKTAIRLDLDNAFETSGNRNRRLFRPNRKDVDFVLNEFRERNRHMSFGITLKQSFGGAGATKVAEKQ